MKKLFLFLVCFPFLAFSQSGKVMDNLSLRSEILDMDRNYAIYLPPDYYTSDRSYPALYLLHGSGDDQTGWVQFGEILQIADRSILNDKSTAMIVVMPDADTQVRGYFNSPDNNWRYEDFFFDELIPHVEKEFRIKSAKRYRAVAGLSMGGGGSFMYALHRPDMFSSSCPLSASTGSRNLENFLGQAERRNIPGTQAQLTQYFNNHSVVQLVASKTEDELKSVKWFIDCGDDDFLSIGNSYAHIALREKNIPHEYRVREGAHNWTYWRESLPEVLAFVSKTFRQH